MTEYVVLPPNETNRTNNSSDSGDKSNARRAKHQNFFHSTSITSQLPVDQEFLRSAMWRRCA